MPEVNQGETDNLIPPRTESAAEADDDNSGLWNLNEPQEDGIIEESDETETENVAQKVVETEEEDTQDEKAEAQAPIKFSPEMNFEMEDGTVVSGNDLNMQRMMHADYSRKMADVTNIRSAAEQYVTQAKQTAEQLTRFTEQLNERVNAQIPPEPDERLLYSGNPADAQKYAAQMSARRNVLAFLNDVSQASAAVHEVTAQSSQADEDMIRFEENMKLAGVLPETSSEQGRRKFVNEMTKFAVSNFGFSEEELARWPDHRSWHVLSYAKKGFDAERASKSARAKIAAAPVVKNPPRVTSQKALSAEDEKLFRSARESARYHGFTLG